MKIYFFKCPHTISSDFDPGVSDIIIFDPLNVKK